LDQDVADFDGIVGSESYRGIVQYEHGLVVDLHNRFHAWQTKHIVQVLASKFNSFYELHNGFV
jgi:hypothetical protein